MLDEARAALAASRPATALSALDAYAAAFPRGAMAPEADVLRIEALVKAGDRAAAMRLADAFLAREGQGPYVERIRSLLAPPKP
jgi:hypothetical protein